MHELLIMFRVCYKTMEMTYYLPSIIFWLKEQSDGTKDC